jgi:hypothetical protein
MEGEVNQITKRMPYIGSVNVHYSKKMGNNWQKVDRLAEAVYIEFVDNAAIALYVEDFLSNNHKDKNIDTTLIRYTVDVDEVSGIYSNAKHVGIEIPEFEEEFDGIEYKVSFDPLNFEDNPDYDPAVGGGRRRRRHVTRRRQRTYRKKQRKSTHKRKIYRRRK